MTYTHVFEPATDAGQRTTLLLLHGTGGDEHDLLPLGRLLAPGAALLSPRGNVPEFGKNRFFRRLAEGVFDFDDVRRRAGELAAFVGDAAARHGFDPARVVAAGFSNGANIGSALMFLHPGVLRAGLFFAPMLSLGADPGPLPAQPAGTRAFLGAGRMDPMAPTSDVERLAEQLRGVGADVTVDWHPGGHQLMPGQVAVATRWLAPLLG